MVCVARDGEGELYSEVVGSARRVAPSDDRMGKTSANHHVFVLVVAARAMFDGVASRAQDQHATSTGVHCLARYIRGRGRVGRMVRGLGRQEAPLRERPPDGEADVAL